MLLTTVLILALFLVVALLIAIIIWLLVRQGAMVGMAEKTSPTVEVESAKQGELELIGQDEPVYAQYPGLLTHQEQRFFWTLVAALTPDYGVNVKVRMGDVLKLTNEPAERNRQQGNVFCRHFDFVLCERGGRLRPLMAIELDDTSHDWPDRKAADEFKDKACASAGLPLLRFPIEQRYEADALRGRIAGALQGVPPAEAGPA